MAKGTKGGKPENLKPFAPGQSGNPNGRPRGSKNMRTVLRNFLELEGNYKNPMLLEPDPDNPGKLRPAEQTMSVMEACTIAMITQVMKGNVHAYVVMRDTLEGKPRQRVEITGNEGKPIEIGQNAVDYSKLPDEVLKAIVAASKNAVAPEKK